MRRGAVWAAVMFLVVVAQLTIVDRLPLPGGGGPDLVLLLVVALGLAQGPVTGALTGFFAGIGLDLAPPQTQPIGASALVFCLVGYGCGWLGGRLSSTAARMLAAGVGTATGAILQAAAARIVGDQEVTLSAARHVLPAAVLYDVLLTPLVVLLVAAANRPRGARKPGGAAASGARLAGSGISGAAVPTIGPGRGRHMGTGRLRLARSGPAVLSGRPAGLRSRPVRLRLKPSPAVRTAAAARARRGRGRRIGVYR